MTTIQDKIADPLKYYNKPNDVESDDTLSTEEKITLLINWLDDINLRSIAESENMPPKVNSKTYIAEVESLLEKYQKNQQEKK